MNARTNDAPATATMPADGRVYWRSMEQLAQTPEYQRLVHDEFQGGSEMAVDDVSRRGFLGLVAAAVAMASTTACRKPFRKILPFAQRPEDLTEGVPEYYATAFQMGGYGTGILVRSNDGRPTKVEGNRLHPASLGGTNAYMQAEVLNVYDPARSRQVMRGGEPSTLAEFETAWRGLHGELGDGDRLALLLPPTTSPTAHELVDGIRARYSAARVYVYEPLTRDNEIEGSRLAFGRVLDAQLDFAAADVVVALDSDFLCEGGSALRHARDFAARRRPQQEGGAERLNRLYAIEPTFSVTGGQADHRFAVRAHQVAEVAFALAAELGVLEGDLATAVAAHKEHAFQQRGKNWIAAIARDLAAHRGRGLVVVGPRQPAVVHAVAHAINAALGNAGGAVRYTEPTELAAQNQLASVRELAAAIDAGSVGTLLILGGNPVYNAPADLAFKDKLAKVQTTIHLGLYRDETARACTWHVPQAHDLEAWSDVRAFDGTVTVAQPLIAPLHGGRSTIELLGLVAGASEHEGHDLVRFHWEENTKTEDFDAWWKRVLRDGLVPGSAYAPIAAPAVQAGALASAVRGHGRAPSAGADGLEVVFVPHAYIADGRYANNAWMQECPDPLTKLTWDNAAIISPGTAQALAIEVGDPARRQSPVVRLELEGRALEMPVWVVPGIADFTVLLPLGYGRELEEFTVARGAGFDTYRLRSTTSFTMGSGLRVAGTGRLHKLVTTQDHGSMEGRPLYREADVATFKANPTFAPDMSPLAEMAKLENKHAAHAAPDDHGQIGHAAPARAKGEQDLLQSLWVERDYSTSPQWGMVIDLNACNGCGACVVACQAENNIPTVGKEQVGNNREMHWLRVDRYFASEGAPDLAAPQIAHQPVPCQQCENAPCESVCPVAATTHSPDGLNDMVYNRCIGTRYCSNNCPFKVRRFNFFDYTVALAEPTLQMVQNPDVTVRSRGVMEKCTYCVQRITAAKHSAKKQGRQVLDGEVVPACGQACPSQAITFGNIVDPDSAVAKLRRSSLNYAMLSERNLKPRTTYLAKVRNPNAELA